MKTQKEIRQAFWNEFPEFKHEFRTRKTQNDYSCDIRCTFVDWIDNIHKDGIISDGMAQKITL